jgi:hypothetical protein
MGAKNKRRNDDLITLAWHIEAMSRHKRLPNLENLLRTKEEQKQRDQESRDFVKALTDAGKITPYTGK